MKKALYIAFAAFILTFLLFHAMPVQAVEFSFNGEYRIRAYAFDIEGTRDVDDTRTYWDQRFRLTMTAKANDNLKGVIRMLAPNNDVWGTQGTYDSSNPWAGGVDYDLAYLDFNIPRTSMNCRIGKQYMSLGNYIVLGSYDTFDALVLNTKIENINLSVFTAKLYEDTVSDDYTTYNSETNDWNSNDFSEDDEDLYGITLSFNPAPNANVGIFGVAGNDGDIYSGYLMFGDGLELSPSDYRDAEATWVGLTTDIDYAPFTLKFEIDYSRIKIESMNADNSDIKAKGYALFGDVCADLGYAKVGAAALYTTGDKDKDESEANYHRFIPISSRFSYMYEWDLLVINKFMELHEGDQCISNLTTFKLYAMKDLTQKTKGTLSVQSYKFSKDPDYSDEGLSTKLGYEIDAIVCHQLYENLKLGAGAAYWITDKETFGDSPDDNWLLKTSLLYTF